jgi:hypothetical protein
MLDNRVPRKTREPKIEEVRGYRKYRVSQNYVNTNGLIKHDGEQVETVL